MTDEETFTSKLIANPGDVTTRLVYADWLDEFTDRHEDARVLRGELTEGQVKACFYTTHWSVRFDVPGEGLIDPFSRICCTLAGIDVPPLWRPVYMIGHEEPVFLLRSQVSLWKSTDPYIQFKIRSQSDKLFYKGAVAGGSMLSFEPPIGISFAANDPVEVWAKGSQPGSMSIEINLRRSPR